MRTTLMLFARLPRPGRVKTRLAATLGDAGACAVYRACAEAVLADLGRVPDADRVVYVADPADLDAVQRWVGPAWRVAPQAPGDLTDRLVAAFDEVFAAGAEAALVTATDTPGLDAAVVAEALDALRTHDAVLVPATDGGYAALGLRRPCPAVFRDIPWSTADVADATRARLRAAGRTWAERPPLTDLDTEDDLRAWLADGPRQGLRARIAAVVGG